MIDADETVETGAGTDPTCGGDDGTGRRRSLATVRRRAVATVRRWPLVTVLPWLIAAVATVAAIVLAVQLQSVRTPAEDLTAVEEAAGRFALALTAWDASDGMADTREALRGASTGTFASEVDELFGGTDDLAELEQIGARSEAEVEDVLVQSLEGDRATALVVIVQRVTTEVTDGAEVSLRYARLGLERDGDRWLVGSVELVVDALQEGARPRGEDGS